MYVSSAGKHTSTLARRTHTAALLWDKALWRREFEHRAEFEAFERRPSLQESTAFWAKQLVLIHYANAKPELVNSSRCEREARRGTSYRQLFVCGMYGLYERERGRTHRP